MTKGVTPAHQPVRTIAKYGLPFAGLNFLSSYVLPRMGVDLLVLPETVSAGMETLLLEMLSALVMGLVFGLGMWAVRLRGM